METKVDEIADRIYRLSTFVPDVGPTGFTFNQFVIDADEPAIFHTGPRTMFPLVSEAVASVVPLDQLLWIMFGHLESDECGAMNLFLAAAPNSQVAHGVTGCMVSINDLADHPPARRARAQDAGDHARLVVQRRRRQGVARAGRRLRAAPRERGLRQLRIVTLADAASI